MMAVFSFMTGGDLHPDGIARGNDHPHVPRFIWYARLAT
jgi:hypothetical protein